VDAKGTKIVGYVHAGWGSNPDENYAQWVELGNDGKYAYLFPACTEKAQFVADTIAEMVKEVLS